MHRMLIAPAVALAAAIAAVATAGAEDQPRISVVMTALDSPRGLNFAPDGDLYVAEAGHGAPCVGTNELVLPPRNVTACIGSSASIRTNSWSAAFR